MKIVPDIAKLLSQGRIIQEQCDELKYLAERDTGSLALNLLIGFGVWATTRSISRH